MFCKFCGKIIDDDSIFCRYCGSRVVTSQEDIQQSVSVEKPLTDTEYKKSLSTLLWCSIKNAQTEDDFREIIETIYKHESIYNTKGQEDFNEIFLETLDEEISSLVDFSIWADKYADNIGMLKSIILPSQEDNERKLINEQQKSHIASSQDDSNLMYVENPDTKQEVIIKGVDEVGKDVRLVDGKIWATCRKNGKWGVFFGDGIVIPCIYDDIYLIERLYGHNGDNACCIECHKDGECGLLSPISGTILAEFGEFKKFDIFSNWPEYSGFSIIGTYKEFDESVGWLERFFPSGKEWFEMGEPKWC